MTSRGRPRTPFTWASVIPSRAFPIDTPGRITSEEEGEPRAAPAAIAITAIPTVPTKLRRIKGQILLRALTKTGAESGAYPTVFISQLKEAR